jgi:small subunit ribosomal protein S6e
LPKFLEQYLANFKLTISDKKGKSLSKELKDREANSLIGLHIGSDLDAAVVGLAGKIRITGGSDKSGMPMRSDIYGSARKPVLLSKGIGLQNVEKGQRRRRLIRGNTISEEIYQINCAYDGELKIEEAPTESKDKA